MESSRIIKHSVVIGRHKTSVSLEKPFWDILREIAVSRRIALSKLIHEVDVGREHDNLSSALRLYVLNHVKSRAGHDDAVGPTGTQG